jgi:hypothetical protein
MHAEHRGLQATNGTFTLARALFQEAFACTSIGNTSPDYNSEPRGSNSNAELAPVHSPLLRGYYLVSYPPLTYMLKFSGFADLTSCLEKKKDVVKAQNKYSPRPLWAPQHGFRRERRLNAARCYP